MKSLMKRGVAFLLVIGVLLTLMFTRYMKDSKDTEKLFRANVSRVKYENTIETALPQTDIYTIIENHFKEPLPDGKTEKKAIIIGYDGCRADVLTEIQNKNSGIKTLMDEGGSLKLTYCGGVNYPAKNTQDTSTAPGWCSVLTGKWGTENGVKSNGVNKEVEPKTILTSLVENKTIDKASFITKWDGHFVEENSTYALEKKYCEEKGLGVEFQKCANDNDSLLFTLDEIAKEDCSDLMFVIYEPTDTTGHYFGFTRNNPGYRDAFVKADNYGYETITSIKERPTYESEDWLIIIASDHGGIGTKHGGKSIQERMTFVAVL